MDESREPPLVTVGVLAHDHAAYLAESLESVLASGWPRLQLVIVDDGSSDGTDAEVRRFLGAHPGLDAVHVRHPAPRGIGATLNEAIALARGEFLTGLSGDDTLLPGGIGARVAYLQERPGKLAVFADAEAVDASGRLLFASTIEGHYARFGGNRRELACDALLPYGLVFHWAVPGPVFLCRRSAFDVVGLYDEGLVTEDFDMYLRLAAAGRLGFLDATVARYRIHPRSMTALQHPRMLADAALAARRRARDFRGPLALRLRAQDHLFRARGAGSLPVKAAFWVRARAESALARAGYRVERWRHRRKAAAPC